jgi:hypothetical protein
MMADSLSFEPRRGYEGEAEVEVTVFIEGTCHLLTISADEARLAGLEAIRAADGSEPRRTW